MGALRAGLGGVPGLQNQSTAQTIKGSLRFDSASSLYLSRPFSSTGNQKTCTFSAWVKRSKLGTVQFLFEARDATGDSPFQFNADDTATIGFSDGTYALTTSQVFRDASAWYHIIIAFDTTQSTESDRVKLYVNGSQITQFSGTYPPKDHVFAAWNKTGITHYISNYTFAGPRLFMDCMSSNIYFIDGQALGPDFFGFTDPLTGTWRPRKFEKGSATVNDGTTWTTDLTTNGGTSWFGGAAANVFDGNTGTFVQGALGGDVTFAPTTPIRVKKKLRIWADSGSGFGVGTGPYQISYNGTQIYNSSMWNSPYEITIAPGTSLSSLVLDTSASGEAMRLFAIEVDGIIMKNATTQILEFGTNGFYLPLDDQDDYTTDKSGKGNNWTANNFSGTFSNPDVVPDSPSGVVGSTKPTSGITTTSSITKPTNYATWNPVGILKESGSTTSTLSDGNLKITFTSGTNASNQHFSTIGPSSGKWYCEWTAENDPSSNSTAFIFGVQQITDYRNNFLTQTGGYAISSVNQLWNNGSNTNSWWSGTATTGDTFALALDLTNSQITFYRNGSSLGDALSIPSDKEYAFCMQVYQWQGTPVGTANFGQRPFKHQPPDGYLTLCSANARPSTVIARPDQYVGIVTYTGNGSTQSIITGFKPDLVWIKSRNSSLEAHTLSDTVRGVNKQLRSNDNIAETTNPNELTSFNSDGFTVGNNGRTNETAYTYVAWTWKAGGNKNTFNIDGVGYATTTAAGLTAGNIAPSGASVGTKQGFSIVTYTGAANGTVPHGLGVAPKFIIAKSRTVVKSWVVYHEDLGINQYLVLQSTIGAQTSSGVWGSSAPTSSVFGLETSANGGNNDGDVVAYCWAEIPGLQKFGTFTANANADGPYVELGFRPVLVVAKKSSGSGTWFVVDAERDKTNITKKFVEWNDADAEASTQDRYDFLSNGFKVRAPSGYTPNETSGDTYIYAAWAEAPAFNLYGGQSLAR